MAVKTPIYLDHQATTPLDPRVLEAMMPYLGQKFGNPHSVTHRFGFEAEAAIDVAREHIAELIGAGPEEIIFTSGATEANNLAIKGLMEASRKNHLITVVSEHKCVLESAAFMAARGVDVTFLGVKPDGLIDLGALEAAIGDETALVSVMHVNNEIGVVQPLEEIGAICAARGVVFHSDAAQSFGKIPINVGASGLGLMSLSGHKIYGPKGVGALYVAKALQSRLQTQISGGGQEQGIRSGTLAPALVAGFGAAARLAMDEMEEETRKITALSSRFRQKILAVHPEIGVNGSLKARYHGNLNLSFPGLDGDLLMANLRELAVSSGAACASATTGPSYVLQAIGLEDALIKSSLRISFGRFTTGEEVDFAAGRINEVVAEMGGLKSGGGA